jgi:hypothetical protein
MGSPLDIILIVVAALVGLGLGIMLVFIVPALKAKSASKKLKKLSGTPKLKPSTPSSLLRSTPNKSPTR